jgi:predicted amidohydrolase YtcJ
MTGSGSLRRRALLRLLAGSAASGLLAGRVGAADGAISLQDIAGDLGPLPEAVIYVAREVVTMDPARPRAEAVAVVGDRIAAVGGRAELEALAGGQAYRVDETFADKVIVPGFVEQHVHPVLASLMVVAKVIAIEDWDTTSGFAPMVRDEAGYRARLTEALAAHRDGGAGPDEVFLTWGYHHYFHGPMDRSLLDELAPDFPVIVWHRSQHEIFVNSRVLELYGVDEAFLATFTPSQAAMSDLARGHFYEQGTLKALERLAPAMATPERMRAGLAFTVDYYHRNGITTACEPGGFYSKALQDAVNVVYAPDSTPFNHYFIGDGKTFAAAEPDDPAAMIAMAEGFLGWGSGRARMLPGQIKLLTDGAIYSQLMQMRDGYTDGHEGAWIMDPDVFGYAFQSFWDAGWQIHVHNNGDLGMEVLLANLETAMRRRPRFDHRTVIVHFGFAAPEQVARAGRLGAIVSANPYYVTALAGRYAEIGIGPERAARMVPLADAEAAGMSISFHSDMPMAPAKPLQLMWSAVNRLTAEGAVSGPDQRVGVERALRAMTIDAAYSIRLENEVGSIEPGKYANFAILGASPFEVEPMALRDIAVWGTVLEGRVQPAPAAAAGDRAEAPASRIERAAAPGPDGPTPAEGDGRARLRLGVARLANDLGLCGDPGALQTAFATAITARL